MTKTPPPPLKKHNQTYAEYVAAFKPYIPSPAIEKWGNRFGKVFGCLILLLVLGVPALLLCGFIGFHVIALAILIVWAISCFKNDVANAVAEKLTKK